MLNRALLALIALLLLGIAALVTVIAWRSLTPKQKPAATPSAISGSLKIDPPRDMPDFTLVDQFGATRKLSDFRDRLVLLTFGYTYCPDVCPLTLNEFRRIQESLGDQAGSVSFLFISVDGERDTPQVMRDYFALRDLQGLVGLTGAEATLRELGADYGLSFERAEADDSGGYLVNHTAGAFLLDTRGRWIMRYPFGVAPSEIAADLKALLE